MRRFETRRKALRRTYWSTFIPLFIGVMTSTLLLSGLRHHVASCFSVNPQFARQTHRRASRLTTAALSATRRRRKPPKQKAQRQHQSLSSACIDASATTKSSVNPHTNSNHSLSHGNSHSTTGDTTIPETEVPLTITKTQARRMKKANLIQTLSLRALNTSGSRNELTARLLQAIDTDNKRAAMSTTVKAGEEDERGLNDKDNITKTEPEPPQLSSSPVNDDNTTTTGTTSDVAEDEAPASSNTANNHTNVSSSPYAMISDNDDIDLDDERKLVSSAALEAVQHDDTESILLDTNRTYVLRVKGFSRVNGTGTGVGIVLCEEDDDDENDNKNTTSNNVHKELREDGGSGAVWTARKYLPGDRSISLAEYTALVLGLQYAVQLGAKHVILETDHDVFAKQLQGVFPVQKMVLKALYWKVMGIKESVLDSFQVRQVKTNDEASELAKKALATGKSLNMTDKLVVDPLGEDFAGFGKHKVEPIGPVGGNDTEVSVIDPSRTYLLQFDGGSRGNPTGKAGCGMVIYDDQDTEVWCGWKYLDPMSNNRAEYHAILYGLLCAQSLGIRKIKAQGDSELVVKQLNGVYKCRQAALITLMGRTKKVAENFDEIEFEFIYRAQNQRADWLANHAMDTESSHGFDEE